MLKNGKNGIPNLPKDMMQDIRSFLVGVLLRVARKEAGVTQEALAEAIHTKKSVISRMENQASDARVSTLRRVAQALGKELVIELR